MPFRKTKANNPTVIDLARTLGRTPASIARKLGNFGAFDPELKKRQITGLTHTGKLDKEVWDEFNSDWGALVLETDKIKETFRLPSGRPPIPRRTAQGPNERFATVKQRIHQEFFRATVLASYDYRCCICGLPHPEILIASHIVPWSVREDTRVNPENGLCLCGSHDRAFDSGLVGVNAELKVECHAKLHKAGDPATQAYFLAHDGSPLKMPQRFKPRAEFLQWHYSERFLARSGE